MTNALHMESSWRAALASDLSKPYYQDIIRFLDQADKEMKMIYPQPSHIFNCFNHTPLDKLKVVILGQDPYHRPHQAMGLSFSVPKSQRIPPSLKNIYKEIQNDLGHDLPLHGDLSTWADQGVLLLNSILTVEEGLPGSHRKIGWEQFTDRVIEIISEHKSHVVFLLWGNFAKKKKGLIDTNKHTVLESAHPSPLARNKFMNNHHFSKSNEALLSHGQSPINWKIT